MMDFFEKVAKSASILTWTLLFDDNRTKEAKRKKRRAEREIKSLLRNASDDELRVYARKMAADRRSELNYDDVINDLFMFREKLLE